MFFTFLSTIDIDEHGITTNNNTRISSRFIPAIIHYFSFILSFIHSFYRDMLIEQEFDKHFLKIELNFDHPIQQENIHFISLTNIKLKSILRDDDY